MKLILPLVLLCGLMAGRAAAVDCVVVFNEVQYHPATNDTASEWLELHNQMAIDIDLSAWSLGGEVGFTFAEGTVIPAAGYLVVAANPAAMQAATGSRGVLGPFTGQLNNNGGSLRLRDRNGRLMDALDYGAGGKWPVAPDGSGATLAKRDPSTTSAEPDHWTASVRTRGTPGSRNFAGASSPPQRRALVPLDSLWRYEVSGSDLGAAWSQPGYDDSTWGGRSAATLLSYWKFDGTAIATRGSMESPPPASLPRRTGMASPGARSRSTGRCPSLSRFLREVA